jgi:hydrogenase maturation protease
MTQRILIAGVGNIFLGDDAFGVEVVRVMAERPQPAGVSVVDYGIRGFDLAYALLDVWDTVILIDALPRGDSPGTLYTLELDRTEFAGRPPQETMINPHGMDPVRVLQLASSMGSVSANIYLVGCEPEDFGDELQGRMGLSLTVQSSVPHAVEMVEALVGRVSVEAGMCSA